MKTIKLYFTLGSLLLIWAPVHGASAQDADMYSGQLGSVHLPVSCNEDAQPLLKKGLALLHHMTYDGAAQAFAAAAEADPQCGMGYWGEALTFIHPLWSDPPTETNFERGQSLIDSAKRLELSEKEKAYLSAVEAYYAAGWNRNESDNLAQFDQAWQTVYQQYPDDLEAAAFYALAHIATADPSDKTFARQKQAGAIAEQVLAQDPDHPGAHHYIIHAYDNPPLAAQALNVARHYGEVAPEVPHALHMPTHIFTRLGLWDESIAWNKRSATAALNHPMGQAISLHYLHALDYLAYAYLQRAEDQKAKAVMEKLMALEGPFLVEVATPYTLAAIPARLALERQQWANAAALEPRTPGNYPWEQFPALEAITHFAQALGAAHSMQFEKAHKAIATLTSLHEHAAATSAYWAKQVEIQRQTATAWLAYKEGKQDDALAMMQQAATLEASTEKHPVTPGEILPARELLGDMFLEMDRYEDAQAAYEASLQRSPNRFNSLYGAGRAAELSGDKTTAVHYYAQLVNMTSPADTKLARLEHARAFLKAN